MVRWSAHGLSKEIKLTSSNHVANARDVVKHPPHMFIVKMLFLDPEHRYSKDPANVSNEKDFEFVGESFPHRPGLASSQRQVHGDCMKK